uniref:Noggin n=1 Tax=Kryptolebias marmoratus TaxID=37003 RepID=A0A3Q3BH45_KRYMA
MKKPSKVCSPPSRSSLVAAVNCVPFFQLRARLPSHSQPIRPYTLLTNADDYPSMPKARHRHPSRLLRLLGSSFDPFWMSVHQPLQEEDTQFTFRKEKLHSSLELTEATSTHRQKLEKEAAELDFGSLSPDVAQSVRGWLVSSAECELLHRWVDLGPTFWPRWLRQTDCEGPDGGRSCSFPRGMKCVRAQTAHIKILAWHCVEVGAMKRCLWRQVPYPVVTSCMCSCK